MIKDNIRYHWTMSAAGDNLRGAKSRDVVSGNPDMESYLEFCEHAENCGIESLLTAFGFHRPDPIGLACTLGIQTKKIKFLIACRSGVTSPTYFVQQINSLSHFIGDRITINMVAGHSPKEFKYYGDQLDPSLRYDRTDEFLTIVRKFWNQEKGLNYNGAYYQITDGRINTAYNGSLFIRPEIYLGGNSNRAYQLASKHADCLWTLPVAPVEMKQKVSDYKLMGGSEVGILVSLIARPTRNDAIKASNELITQLNESSRLVHKRFVKNSVSKAFNETIMSASKEHWKNDFLWTGAVPYLGAPSIAIVGSYQEVAEAILAYNKIGVSQFLFKGWPDLEEMSRFHNNVAPIVKDLQAEKLHQKHQV